MRYYLLTTLLVFTFSLKSQKDTSATIEKERLDFALGFFELGGTFLPSFSGKQSSSEGILNYDQSATLNSTFYWGAFHFWGHAEFYVSFPLNQLDLSKKEGPSSDFNHFTITGARYYPWAVSNKKIRPYVGLSWSALDIKQNAIPGESQPILQKNFTTVADFGLLYKHNKWAARLGISYFPQHQWDYPISKTEFASIETPKFGVQLGVMYTTDFTKNNGDQEINDRWNSYPTVSKVSYNATSVGDFFVGAGPSISFNLNTSDYNASEFPFLSEKYASLSYFDVVLGYQFNKQNAFAALSYRNPTFEQEGYGTTQTINKTSVALEVTKFLTDYSGFAPFIGLNVAYDDIKYSETSEQSALEGKYTNIEPGITFGWDILPGKTEEYLILRTNLRWYPLADFEVKNKDFKFGQLEYNLIQVVFYPERFIKSKRKRNPA